MTPAAQPALTLSATNVDFQNVVLGHTLTRTLHVTNSGKTPLQISSISVSNKQFDTTGPSVPRTLLPAMTIDYTIAFSPTSAGTASASLTFGTNASNIPASVSLKGVGEKVLGAIAVSPSSISFGNLNLNTTAAQSVTLQNTGDINVTLSGVTVVGAGFGFSDLSPGYSLAPNQKVTFQVWFRPQKKGVAAGAVSILSANLVSPAEVSVSGDGVDPSQLPPPAPPPVQHTVHLSWNPSTGSIAGYRVYRSTVSGSFGNSLFSSALNVLTYDDSTVTSGDTYYYTVTTVDNAGVESPPSNQAAATIPNP
jgi:hypothetical protein